MVKGARCKHSSALTLKVALVTTVRDKTMAELALQFIIYLNQISVLATYKIEQRSQLKFVDHCSAKGTTFFPCHQVLNTGLFSGLSCLNYPDIL